MCLSLRPFLSFFESLLPHNPFLLVLLLFPLLAGFVCESNITARQRKKKGRRETLKRASRASSGHARGPQAKHAKGSTQVGRKTDKKLKYEKKVTALRTIAQGYSRDRVQCVSFGVKFPLVDWLCDAPNQAAGRWLGRRKEKKRSAVFESPPFPLSHSTDLFFTVQKIKGKKEREARWRQGKRDGRRRQKERGARVCTYVCLCVSTRTPTLSTAAAHFLVRSPWSLPRNEREAHLKQQQKGEKWVRKGCRTMQT